MFIVFEGVDRAGKTTQIQRLIEHLKRKGVTAGYDYYPRRASDTGKAIAEHLETSDAVADAVADDRVLHLLFSANRWENEYMLRSMLAHNDVVVCDRYTPSGVAYSVAKGLDFAWCTAPDVGLPRPDLVLYLDLPAEVAEQRGGYGKERYENTDMQARVRKVYEEHYCDRKTWVRIDADGTIDQVAARIAAVVDARMKG